MAVDTKTLLQLRKITGAGINDCHEALEQSNNDIEKAIEFLRKKGTLKAAKKADRETKEGVIEIEISKDNKSGSIIAIHCESDFVAKNNDFIQFVKNLAHHALSGNVQEEFNGKKEGLILKIGENITLGASETLKGEYVEGYIHANKKVGVLVSFNEKIENELAHNVAIHIAAFNPSYTDKKNVPKEVIDKELEIYHEQLKNEKKPEAIIEKIAQGKLQKFFEENCLLLQPFVKDDKKTVREYLDGHSAGRKIEILSFIRYKI